MRWRVPASIKQLAAPRAYLVGGTLEGFDLFRVGGKASAAGATRRYEAALESLLGVGAAFAYSSGRAALMEVLCALGIGAGDEVILPGYTCIVVPAAIQAIGARPVYADIDIRTFNIAPEAVEAKITRRTRAILAQHTYGIPCDIPLLQQIADSNGFHLIEDGAHALGAKFADTYCGNHGIAAFFSTEQSKMISTVKGGIATTNDTAVAEKLRGRRARLSSGSPAYISGSVMRWRLDVVARHPRVGSIATKAFGAASRSLRFGAPLRNAYEYDRVEYARAIDGIVASPAVLADRMAAIGLSQLRRLEADVAARNRLARCLEPIAQQLGWATPQIEWSSMRPSFIRYPFLTERRSYWQKRLADVGVETGTWLSHPLHPAGSRYEECGYEMGMCPTAEYVCERVLNIPIHRKYAGWLLDRIDSLVDR